MAHTNALMFPVQEGKEAAARAFAAECSGARAAEHDAMNRIGDGRRVTWHLMGTPMGSVVLVWVESGEPPAVGLGHIATATGEFEQWFRGQVLDISGIDMSQPPDGPEPETLVDWSAASGGTGEHVNHLAFPVLEGQDAAARAFAEACLGDRRDGFEAMQAAVGATRETWHLNPTPMGAFVQVWTQGTQPADKAFEYIATSTGEFEVWFRDQVQAITGADMSEPPEDTESELILDWSA